MGRRLVLTLAATWLMDELSMARGGVLVRSTTSQPEDELSMLRSELALKDVTITELEKALQFANSKLHEMLRNPNCAVDDARDDRGQGASRRLETRARDGWTDHDPDIDRDDPREPPSCSDEPGEHG